MRASGLFLCYALAIFSFAKLSHIGMYSTSEVDRPTPISGPLLMKSQSIYLYPLQARRDYQLYYIDFRTDRLIHMISGQMVEAQKGCAVLGKVDEDTFRTFIKWGLQRVSHGRQPSICSYTNKC